MIRAGVRGAAWEDLLVLSRLFLVDGNPRTLRVLEVNLRSAGFSVDTATTGSEAWARIQLTPPGLVIADTDIKGIDGFELCARLRQTPGGTQIPFILLVADHTLDQKVRSLEAGADEYLVKPVYVKEVLARVRALLQRKNRARLGATGEEGPSGLTAAGGPDRFDGDLNDIAVVDLLRLLESGGRSGIIQVRGDTGATGSVYFRRGQIVDAEVGHLTGLDALSRLFAWTRGAFEVEWKTIRRNDVIGRPTGDLVIDGMQRLDEWNRLSQGFAPLHAIFEVDYALLAERLAEIPDEVNEILRLCDGARTLRQVIEDSTVPDIAALTALIRLRAEGIIYDIANKSTSERAAAGAELHDWLHAESSPVPSPVPTSPRSAEILTDLSGGVRPPRRQTAPGLGQDPPAIRAPDIQPSKNVGDGDREAIPQTRVERGDAIELPAFEDPRHHPQRPAPVLADSRTSPQVREAAAPQVPEAAARAPGAMSRTHRGFGATASTEPGSDIATPVAAPDQDSGGYPRTADRAGRLDGGIVEKSERTRPPPGTALPPPSVAVGESGSAGAAEGTMILGFPDEDISHGEALDELGLPSRWRALRFLAAAAFLGGLLAVVAGRWHAALAPSIVAPVVHSSSKVEPVAVASPQARISPQPSVETRPKTQAPLAGPSELASPEGVAREHAPALRPDQVARAGNGGVVAVGATVPAAVQSGTSRTRVAQAADGTSRAQAADETSRAQAADGTSRAQAADGTSRAQAADGTSRAQAAHLVELPDPKLPKGGLAPELPGVPSARSGQATPLPRLDPENRPPVPSGAPASIRGSAPPPPRVSGFVRQLEDCRAAFARNRLREALAACGAAVAANPHSAEALTLMAHTELNRGRLSQAADLASKALAVDPNVPDAYVIIGGVRQDSGQNAEAKAAYRRYLQLAPHGRYAEDLRSIVNSL